MLRRLRTTVIAVTLLGTGCTSSVDGRGSVASTRTLGTPGGRHLEHRTRRVDHDQHHDDHRHHHRIVERTR